MQRKTELVEAWKDLMEKTQERSVTLADSVEVHQVGRLWVWHGCGIVLSSISTHCHPSPNHLYLTPTQYYTESHEAESWMVDRKPLVASKDYGKDETKAEVLLKKHEAVELDIEGFGATITQLSEKAVIMMERGHYDRCVRVVCVCGLCVGCVHVHVNMCAVWG